MFIIGITLYPNDYVKDIFKEFISRVSAPTQLIIHRDGAIMNYGYIRKLENNHLFGICIQVNGQSLTTINKLFEVFEDITTNVVVRGDIIQLNRQGNLISNIVELTDKSEEVERIVNYCQLELEKLSSDCQTLPPIDYSTTDNDVSRFRDSDNNQDIVNSSVKNGYTFIYKAHDYDSLALSGYRTILSSLNKENEANRRAIKELNSQLSKLKRQKKQLNVVVGLILTLFIASFIFFNTIEEKNKDIESKQKTINIQTSKNSELANENRDILSRQYELYDAYNQLDSSYKRLSEIGDNFKIINSNFVNLISSIKNLSSFSPITPDSVNSISIQSFGNLLSSIIFKISSIVFLSLKPCLEILNDNLKFGLDFLISFNTSQTCLTT